MSNYPVRMIRKSAQAGFTLIELIVVIVILGILAATALPKFMDVSSDARAASVQAVKGALTTASAFGHAKWLINPSITSVSVEGSTLTLNASSGYPTGAVNNISSAAGLNITTASNPGDYTQIAPGSSGGTSPTTSATPNQVAFVPTSVAGTAKAVSCYASYTESTTANVAPTIVAVTTSC